MKIGGGGGLGSQLVSVHESFVPHELPLLGVHDSGIAGLLFGLLQMSGGIGIPRLVEMCVSYLGH